MALLAAADGGLRGLVVDEHGKPVDKALVRIEELNVELETRERGEWWRLVGPGKYTVTASSVNKFGTLRCAPVKVEVETALGRGPGTTVRIVLQLLPVQNFLVSCVLAIPSRPHSLTEQDLIRGVKACLPDCTMVSTSVDRREVMQRSDVEILQSSWLVETILPSTDTWQYFKERWGCSPVLRPTDKQELAKLEKRMNHYCRETYCGQPEQGWTVKLAC